MGETVFNRGMKRLLSCVWAIKATASDIREGDVESIDASKCSFGETIAALSLWQLRFRFVAVIIKPNNLLSKALRSAFQ